MLVTLEIIIIIIAQTIFFFLPAYFANMSPVLFEHFGWMKFLAVPVDCGRKLFGERLFGDHKTYRGIVAGAFTGTVTLGFQILLYLNFPQLHWLYLFSYQDWSVLILGFLLGFGALFGDLMKSFVKRRLHIKDGSPLVLLDQLDFVVGGLGFASFLFLLPWPHIYFLFILTPLLHLAVNILGYFLKLKKVWW